MQVIKITAIWCSGCLIMNKRWNNILKKEDDISTISLDYDMDSDKVKEYHIANTLPVFIFKKNGQEVKRIVGEMEEKEILKIIEELKHE